MGTGVSVALHPSQVYEVLKTEALRPRNAQDVAPEDAVEEVKRLRQMISYLAQEEERTARYFKGYKLSHVEDITCDDFCDILFTENELRDQYKFFNETVPFKDVNALGNECIFKEFRYTFSPPPNLKLFMERMLGRDCSMLIWEFSLFNLDVLYLRWPLWKGGCKLTGIIIPEVGTFVEKVYKSSNKAFTSRIMSADEMEKCFYSEQQLRARRDKLSTLVAAATSRKEKEGLLARHKQVSGVCDGAYWLKKIPNCTKKTFRIERFISTLSKYNMKHRLMEMFGGFQFHGTFNRDDGCLDGNGLVALAGGCVKRVDEIVPGDRVCSGKWMAETAVVTCVTRQRGNFEMSRIQANTSPVSPPLFITPFHPIRVDNEQWAFPKNVSDRPTVEKTNTVVYNFVLGNTGNKKTPSIWVNNVECIVLGHLLEDPVVKHKVYGGNEIRQYLQSMPEYPVVDLPSDGFTNLAKQVNGE